MPVSIHMDGLIARDWLPERLTSFRVRDGFADGRLSDPERLCGDGHTAALQRPHRDVKPLIHRAQRLVVGDLDVEIEVHADQAPHA